MQAIRPNRKLDALAGLVIGLFSFLLAESLVPSTFRGYAEHDLLLSVRLGLIYTPLAACWIFFDQLHPWESLRRNLWIGLLLGVFYGCLCELSASSATIMILFPAIVGGAFNAILSRPNLPIDFKLLLHQCSDGIIAGSLFGLIYATLLNGGGLLLAAFGLISLQVVSHTQFVHLMWIGGTCALGFASAVFFWLMRRFFNAAKDVTDFSFKHELIRLAWIGAALTAVGNWKLFLLAVTEVARHLQ